MSRDLLHLHLSGKVCEYNYATQKWHAVIRKKRISDKEWDTYEQAQKEVREYVKGQ